MKNFRFPLLIFLVIIFSFVQFLDIQIFGVKPDLPLVFIAVLVFFIKNPWEGIFLTSLSAFILKFSPQPSKEILTFLILGILMSIIYKYFPWHSFINSLVLVVLATLVFYALLNYSAILSSLFFKELAYNLFFGAVLFSIFRFFGFKRML